MATPNRSTCKIDHCTKSAHTAGFCQTHYNRNYRTGDPLSRAEKVALGVLPEPPVDCSIEGCDRPISSRGMCSRHYANMRQYGHAIPRRDWSIERTLDDIGWDRPGDGCWEWRGDRNEFGYGLLTLSRKGLFKARVHRLMFERHHGTIPAGMIVRHKCDNPPCSNPDHLELGTPADNTNDMIVRGRHWRHGATECRNGHDISSPGSYRIGKRKDRGDEKICLTCQRERHLRHQEKKNLERAKLRDYSEAA